jgi:hypothetical protein
MNERIQTIERPCANTSLEYNPVAGASVTW